MGGCSSAVAWVLAGAGGVAVLLGVLGAIMASTAGDCEGFQCMGRALGETAAGVLVPTGLVMLVMARLIARRVH